MDIGLQIKKFREQQKISQEELLGEVEFKISFLNLCIQGGALLLCVQMCIMKKRIRTRKEH